MYDPLDLRGFVVSVSLTSASPPPPPAFLNGFISCLCFFTLALACAQFVLTKALAAGLRPMVVLNKVREGEGKQRRSKRSRLKCEQCWLVFPPV